MIAKVKNILKTLPEGQITQPSIKHLAATGLSENNIKLLQSINITYDNLDNLNFKLFSNLTSDNIRESTYQRIMKAYTEFEALVFIDKNNGNATSTNKEALLKNYLESLEPGSFFTINQLLDSQPFLNEKDDVDFFLKKDLLIKDNMWYRKKYKELHLHIKENSSLKNIDVLIERLNGKSMQELADEQNVSRQSISNREKMVLKKISFTEEEALYKKFFESFNCSKNIFCDLFNETEIVYNFLNIRLKKGKKDLLKHINEYPFTDNQRITILQHYKGFINHKNELTSLSKISVFEDVLFFYGRNSTNDNMLLSKYNEHIIKHNYDIELAKDATELRGLHERSVYALQDRGCNYRYYDFNQLDNDEIKHLKELLILPPGIYNMNKIFSENLEFMKSIDIRNENELHNLYKAFISIENVTYNRMPEFSVGNTEKKEFIINLFFEQAPIHINDFVDYVNDVYYLKKNSLKSYLQMSLSEYISDDIIQVKYKDVKDSEVDYLQSVLTSDIHTIEEITELGSQKLDDFSNRFMNNMLLNKLGYNIRGQFILTNKYRSVERYFTDAILKNDYFINERLAVHRTQSFWKTIYDLEKNLDIFKVDKDTYITLGKLEQVGISKSIILDFQNKVKKFVGKDQYFSLSLLQKKGFTHELLNLGFEDIFYNRILWADSEIKGINLAAGYIFILQENDVSLIDFLEWLVHEHGTIDGHDLVDYIYKKYNILIELQKAITLLQKNDVYYSPELSKFYCDKDMFFEEIYK
ncbi:hypothetical protein FCT18_17460 [Lysinibacillus sphaericus]|nr:hypothetical protein [Lysinibacillus sphaericus]AVK95643.1 hypothetical protein LS41612_04830 [Lysinibacillus sphaericus]MED4545618.1 hypothetical protein [Lysinibacillus sphaericus]TKI17588.1 hypothetical protein FCT18_17460 [Lysinibacillus sphaericus]